MAKAESIAFRPMGTKPRPRPVDIAVAPDGTWVLADITNHMVWEVAADGASRIVAGTGCRGSTDGPGSVATLDGPFLVVVDRAGVVFVLESNRIRRIARTVGGGWVVGTLHNVVPHASHSIAIDPGGHLVVVQNHRVLRVHPKTGTIAVLVDNGILMDPISVAVDHLGDIFIIEFTQHRIKKISGSTHAVTTVAGSGLEGAVDGPGPAAQFSYPRILLADGRGELVVWDGWYKNCALIRRIAPSADRTVTTVPVISNARKCYYGAAIDRDGTLLMLSPTQHEVVRVTGLGLVPPGLPAWSLWTHKKIAAAVPTIRPFVTTVMLCARRLDLSEYSHPYGLGGLPVEMWWAILAMLRPDQMVQ